MRESIVIVTPTANLLSSLVQIDSINPSLVPGAAGETEMARFVKTWLNQRGVEANLHDTAPNRPSVLARVPGKGGGSSLLLNAHLDTAGVDGMSDPFTPRIHNGRMYGRGAYDMKAGLAACMLALAEIPARELAGDVLLAAVADEEHASLGIQDVVRQIRADAAIVTEPTSLEVCIAHKGFSWHEIVTSGRAAHGSQPQLGIDAIVHMGRVLNRLEAGIPTVAFGPHGAGAHAIDEWVELNSVDQCRAALVRTIRSFSGAA